MRGIRCGFGTISLAPPRLHPRSFDVLATGMVMNVEPAIYLSNFGARHCEVVAVGANGAGILSGYRFCNETFIDSIDEIS
jgi:Xaa-Pro aminopeptidase